MPTRLPYGTWPSPIDAATVAAGETTPNWPQGLAEEVWWTEPRPAEDGRVTLCRVWLDEGAGPAEDLLGAPWNIRSRVNEYGGRPYTVVSRLDGPLAVFVEFSDQRMYRMEPGLVRHPEEMVSRAGPSPTPLTPAPDRHAGLRYVEPIVPELPSRGARAESEPSGLSAHLDVEPEYDDVWCIREVHHSDDPTDVSRDIVAIPLDGSAADDPQAIRVLVDGDHFLACPRVSPDGRHLAWLGWNHPDMPWDTTTLWVGDIAAGHHRTITNVRRVAAAPNQSIVQVEWASRDTLYYCADPDGWWNIHRQRIPETDEPPLDAVNLCQREEEFGGALWQPGSTWFLPLPSGDLVATHGRAAMSLGRLNPNSGQLVDVDTPHTEWFGKLTVAGPAPGRIVGVAAAPDRPSELVEVAPVEGTWRVLNRSVREAAAPGDHLPRPETRTVTDASGQPVHATVYPPHNPDVCAPETERPPYVLFVHGGPTGRAPVVRNLEIAFFTSRGIGVAEVNYGGSTGHGRDYRERLRHNWGLVDVADCVTVAQALVAQGADPQRLAIRGGSAGGWTSAAALAGTDTFACATIKFPILDLVGWRTGETHDFESQYLESLVGPWPDTRDRYAARSPVNQTDRISAPFLLLQGLDDRICPPVQCERFLERIRDRALPHAYRAFSGEQHGFRRSETIVAALESELGLYCRVFGFDRTDIAALEFDQ
ncbi:prolyl oligopeptidase family serine peptidase [Lipingzhangella sp. LS1_29]|uniref:Prolyl oligopeptidase family serine peptidase n=1 Tax=Lipingzhangella rawalii TaxID=2055835 RepID=A0ABU2H2L5_9ACTN|nr:prolyl oligopeptidase family serine peptidase [Lipingzhangella rawalii]MDS1269545.1 prolyl oligopeptidase family serine peptidase [Lipingzhangella rawalii]